MSLCDDIRQAKSGKEIVRRVESDARFVEWRDSGSSHRIAKFQNGTTLPVAIHGNKDVPIGTKMKMIRILRAGGLCIIVLALALFMSLVLTGG
jgi:predicted RNA binding protein YcfA (HicA-like mRNA interferase family)